MMSYRDDETLRLGTMTCYYTVNQSSGHNLTPSDLLYYTISSEIVDQSTEDDQFTEYDAFIFHLLLLESSSVC